MLKTQPRHLALFLAIAMGFQNGAVREAFAGYPPTTVMTSTLVTGPGGVLPV